MTGCRGRALREGDPRILVVFDAGYDVTRRAWLLADLPVALLGRRRSDRVMWLPVPAPQPGTIGRPRKHGREMTLADRRHARNRRSPRQRWLPGTGRRWCRVGPVNPRLTHRAAWLDHDGPLPNIEGNLIRLQVDHLPGDRSPKPMWLWSSGTGQLLVRWTTCGRRSCAV